jgi:hypothetical protein
MYRKTLIALACAVISVPAFAQGPESSRYRQLPPCPSQLTRNQAPCANLEWNRSPPSPPPKTDERTSAERYGWGRNPPAPPSTLDTLGKKFERSGPTYRDGLPGWRWGREGSEHQSHR